MKNLYALALWCAGTSFLHLLGLSAVTVPPAAVRKIEIAMLLMVAMLLVWLAVAVWIRRRIRAAAPCGPLVLSLLRTFAALYLFASAIALLISFA